jgi:hypothetical protein
VTSKAGVSLQYRLYDNLADAVNGNTTTSVKNVTKPYISFQAGFSSTPGAGSAIANVSATQGAYLRFTDGSLTAQLGNFAFAFDANVAAAGGAALAATELGSTSTVVVTAATGNFSFAANANGGFDTLSNVRFTNGADCTAATNVAASSITSTTATFTNVPASFFSGPQRLCVTARSGAPIGAGTYQLSSTIAGTSTSYGNFASASSVASWSTITQNGATINIPLVQTPAGFIIRLAVTNSGSSARAYTVSTVAETGATATVSGALALGEFAAGRLTIIDLPGLLTVTGAPNNAQRTALRMIVNAPASEIRAVYQVTAPNGTSVSNQPLTVE